MSLHRMRELFLAPTVYGDRRNIAALTQEARGIVQRVTRACNKVLEALTDLYSQAQQLRSFEEFMQPDCQAVRQKSVASIYKVIALLKNPPDGLLGGYMARELATAAANFLAERLAGQSRDALARADADLPVWQHVWAVITQDGPTCAWYTDVEAILRPVQHFMAELADSESEQRGLDV
ncbi:hypothetical protein FA95DRAFT_598231 [Auriscalpium vulgare]|uniref:Uncharacterized protein n=1 Tax=Auriscalpium vulgare TaxID=40419 RepID=A0ACB8S1R9_9AGAM|nr:hypothetical protein FA95DRAFT_598231 [Auriscalpium vulgare]